jgi:hypothetical protein
MTNPFAFALRRKRANLEALFDSYLETRRKFCKDRNSFQDQFDQALEDLVNKLITSEDQESALRLRCFEQLIRDSEELSLGQFEALALIVQNASDSERILISSYFINTLSGSNAEHVSSALAVMQYLITYDEERRAVHIGALLDCLNNSNEEIQRDATWALYETRVRTLLDAKVRRKILTVAKGIKRDAKATYSMDSLLHYLAQVDESLRDEINQVFKSWKHEPYEARTVELPKQIEDVLGPKLSSSLREVIPHFHGMHEFADSLLNEPNRTTIKECFLRYMTDLIDRFVSDDSTSRKNKGQRTYTNSINVKVITDDNIAEFLSEGPVLIKVQGAFVVASRVEMSENLPEILLHCYITISTSEGIGAIQRAIATVKSLLKKLRSSDLELVQVLKDFLEELEMELGALQQDT